MHETDETVEEETAVTDNVHDVDKLAEAESADGAAGAVCDEAREARCSWKSYVADVDDEHTFAIESVDA